jgi:glycosyltransferase involved in cell wall biosynthesis
MFLWGIYMNVNFVSTGPKFPYSYYIGVLTAMRSFPGEVVLWITKEPKSRYFEILKKQKNLKIEKVAVDSFPVLDSLTEHEKNVAVFDYLSWKIASKHGGIIAGLDSVTIKRWDDLLPKDKELLAPVDGKDTYSMHGVAVNINSSLAKKIFEDICTALQGKEPGGDFKSLKDGRLVWGGAGIIPYINNVRKNKDKVEFVEKGMLGGVNPDSKEKGFYLHQDKKTGEFLHKDTRTIPLYASSNKNFDKINEDYVANSNSLYSEIVKNLLPENVWNPFKKPLRKTEKKFRFHLLGLAHLPVSEKYMSCAFTQKIVKLSKMLLSLGHEVYLYGSEGSDAPCTEFIQTHTLKDIRDSWGEGDNRFEIGYNWKTKQFKHDFNSAKTETTKKYYNNCVIEINKRKKSDDFLLLTQGQYQKIISKGVDLYLTCEPGVGYRGSFTRFRAFESAYLQNFTYGSEHPFKSINGNYYDRVIPNYFDAKDFEFSDKKDNYFLYIGRMINRKGVWTAIKTTQAIGAKLILAGQADPEIPIKSLPKHCEFIGYVGVEERKKLMAKARAVFVPTIYLEAFAGTHIESMLSGTPPITTDFGVFPGTIPDNLNGKVGFRCNTLQDFYNAAIASEKVDHKFIRKYAERFLMKNIKWEYQKWFKDLYYLWESTKGTKKGWHRIEKRK